MKPVISSLPSPIPGWYDPELPNFKPPKSWKDTRVRIHVPISTQDPNKELAEARIRFEKKFPGALLHLVPEFQKTGKPDEIQITGSDEELLEQYFSKIELPDHISSGQLIAYLSKYLPSFGAFGVQGFRFLDLYAENVLCFEKVSWSMKTKGLTLVTGKNLDWGKNISNGAGKSSLTSLPFIGLFGRTFKNQTHDEWANQNNEKKAFVNLKIELKDGRQICIERSRRPQLLRVWSDDKEITMGSPSATQTLIEKLTGFTWEILENAVYIGQHELGSVFGTEKQRKELFSRLLGLDRFLVIQDKLRKVLSKMNKTINEFEIDVADSIARLDEAEQQAHSMKVRLNNIIPIDESEITSTRRKIATFSDTLKQKRQKSEDLEKALQSIRKSISSEETKIAGFTARIELHSDAVNDLNKLKDKCFTCLQPVSKDFVKKEIKRLNTLVHEQESQIKICEATCSGYDVRHANETLKLHELRSETRKLESELVKLSSLIVDLDARKTLREGIRNDFLTARERVQKNKTIAEVNKQALKFTLEDKQFLEICIESVGRNGLPAFLCSAIAPQLNKTITFYSEIFTEGEIAVRFRLENGDIELDIENQHGGQNLQDQSAGEMSIAARMVALTFRDVFVPLNLLVLDEPSEGLDSENSLNFARGLKQIQSRFDHIVIITHNAHILGALDPDHRIEVVKQNKNSKVRFF